MFLMGIKAITPARPHRFTDGILDPIHRHMRKGRMASELEKHILDELD